MVVAIYLKTTKPNAFQILAEQERQCRAWVQSQGAEVFAVYFDVGGSGRQAWQTLCKLARQRKFMQLVVTQAEPRRHRDWNAQVQLFQRWGVQVQVLDL